MNKGGFPGGMQQFMKQANQLQSRIKKLQEELDEKTYSATSGGDAVKVTVNGKNEVTALAITKEVMEAGDTEMLQDLILTATNDALKQARVTRETEMEKVTGGMSMPGLF